MKAAVYFGPGDIRCINVDTPGLAHPHEVLVRVEATSICGSDLHIYEGRLDDIMRRGHSRTGHELVGEIVETGRDVTCLNAGDRITMAYSCSCGACHMCRVGQTAHCETTNKAVYGFGDAFGDLNGTHAEYIVLPYASAHALRVPDELDAAAAVSLSCNLPSAIIANELASIQRGDNVALIGCGPTGLMALHLALSSDAASIIAIDPVAFRLDAAAATGAIPVNSTSAVPEAALAHTSGRGFDKVIEMVGAPESFRTALNLVRPGGTIAALGVFTTHSFNLDLADIFLRDISLHLNGFANVQPYLQKGLELITSGVINPADLFSHEFNLDEIDKAFDTFATKADGAMKILVRPFG